MSLFPFETHFIQYYNGSITEKQWKNPTWQFQNRFTTLEQIEDFFPLDIRKDASLLQRFPFAVTPYYLALAWKEEILQRLFIPNQAELTTNKTSVQDPLSEETYTKTKAIIHKYPNRVLYLLTNICPVYCRYCTRSRFTGKDTIITKQEQQQAWQYIKDHQEIEEVIISGGDPLFVTDSVLLSILKEIEKIDHIRYIRIHTRTPVVLPYRITEQLVSRLAKIEKPLWIHLHILHPAEITPPLQEALNKLRKNGISLFSQTVLLHQINDDEPTMLLLIQQLLASGIRPYALYQCDLVAGTDHFRTPLNRGVQLIEMLRHKTSGIGVPHFVVEPPEGKVTLSPNNIIKETEQDYRLRAWNGKLTSYPKE